MSVKLYEAGIHTLTDLCNSDGRRLEVLLSRNSPYGNQLLQQCLSQFPLFGISATPSSQSEDIEVRLEIDKRSQQINTQLALLIVGQDSTGNPILFFQKRR